MRKIVYSIEGNIGSGKSTLLKLLSQKMPQIVISPQPIDIWQKVNTYNLLNTYYQNPHRWAYTFQNFALITRMNQLSTLIEQNNDLKKIVFSERSVRGDRQIFAKLLYEEGKMNEMEFQLYETMYEPLLKLYSFKPEFYHIYLRTSPQKCMKRIKKRGRQQESNISMDYINHIDHLHEKWLGNSFIIQGNEQFENNQDQLNSMISKIKLWIQSHNME